MGLAARVDRAIRAAGVPIVSLSIGDDLDKSTWLVQPPELQAQAQPVIDAFSLVEPPPLPLPTPGRYLGIVHADPESPNDGDLWVVREAYPTQRRTLKFRDGAVTRTLQTITL